MKKIRIELPYFTRSFLRFFTITTIVSLAFMQTSYAQKNTIQTLAAQKDSTQQIDSSTTTSDAYQNIQAFFQNTPGLSIQRYNQELLEVNIGARSFLASNDGRYVYLGKVFDMHEKIDISEQITRKKRVTALDKLDDKNQLSFPATVKELFAVTLFTDVDCGYCRRFHSNMAQYNALGIRVNYLMFPRAGKNSQSYDKTAAILCSQNPQVNMTLAMKGKFSASTSLVGTACKYDLDEQMLVAAEFGISATPTILFQNGDVIAGVLSPEQLLAQLQQ